MKTIVKYNKVALLSLCIVAISYLFAPRVQGQTNNTSSKVTDVWIVTKTHFDLGYTNQAVNVFERYRTEMMDSALKIIDDNKKLPKEQRFVWTVPAWPLWAQMLGPLQDSARKVRVEQAVKEGYIAAHALPFNMHTESLNLEDLVRGLSYADRVNRKYNLPLPIAAKMTDVPSHSWVLPTLLKNAGVEFLQVGTNGACQYPRVPQLFWWQGADGSRILCDYTTEYGSTLFPPADWPCKNYLALMMNGDNQGPPSLDEVAGWRKQYAEKMPNVRVHFGTLDDCAKAVLAEKTNLPVVRGDMPDTWIHGLMSMPKATKTARVTRALEPALQTLNTQLRLWGLHPANIDDSLDKAYEQSLLYGEHTWGMTSAYGPRELFGNAWKQWLQDMENEPVPANGDYSKVPRGSKRKWMQSYEDHKDYAAADARIVNTELQKQLKILASSVKTNGKSIVVYNALPWKRSGVVHIDGETIFVKDIPANGYKTIPYTDHKTEQIKAHTTKIETPYFIATFDLAKGGIESLIDKQSGKELKDPKSDYVIGQFLHEKFSRKEVFDRFYNKYSRGRKNPAALAKPGMPDTTQWPYRAITPGNWTMSHTASNVADVITLTTTDTKGLADKYSITFTFPKAMPYVDVDWKVADKVAEKNPEGGWLCFPFNIPAPKFIEGRLGAPIDPAKDIVTGTNRFLNAISTGVAVNGSAVNMAVCPIDAPLVSLGEPGLWHFAMQRVPKKPVVFVNLYNNMWNTNFPLWQDGSWRERVRLWPVGKDENKVENLTVKSWEARLPLMARVADNKNGTLVSAQQGLSVSRKGVLVTAFGDDIDGNKGTILRLWEQDGISGKVTVGLPGKSDYKTAKFVNLRGESLNRQMAIHDNKIVVEMKAYAPVSLILE